MFLNKEVLFDTAKLLKEKGFNEPCSHYYIDNFQNIKHDGVLYKTSLPDGCDRENIFQYVRRDKQYHLCNAPKISDVLDWLYEKHYIWIEVSREYANGRYIYEYFIDINNQEFGFNTPQEAYESAIKKSLEGIKYYDK